ncbi:hypothetical protein [Vulcanisaeta distributa]|uniref:hypothetical protein n=1 Tax=Vulcanisaeta distributa TaxID=164451 RepID=UPI0011E50396|nr:hypothetical protein [Vulcanisaeta distributa]
MVNKDLRDVLFNYLGPRRLPEYVHIFEVLPKVIEVGIYGVEVICHEVILILPDNGPMNSLNNASGVSRLHTSKYPLVKQF